MLKSVKYYLSPYFYYSTYFIPCFLAQLYSYSSYFKIPVLRKYGLLLNLFYQRSQVSFFHSFGLLFLTFLQSPTMFRKIAKGRPYQWQYYYRPRKCIQWDLYLKYWWLLLGKTAKVPLSAGAQTNSLYQYTFKTLRTPELHYYQLQLYDQGWLGFSRIQFFLRGRVRSMWEETNVLRLLNVPLHRRK